MSGLEKILIFLLAGEMFHHFTGSTARPSVEIVPMLETPMPFPVGKPFTKFAVGTLTSMLLGKLLYLGKGENAQCALSIHNKLTSHRLVNPYLFIVHGGNAMPVPLKIKTNSSEEMSMEGLSQTDATSGLLFYEIESTSHYLTIFWKVQNPRELRRYKPNRFSVDITSTFRDDPLWLENLYNATKKSADQVVGPNEHFEIKKVLPTFGNAQAIGSSSGENIRMKPFEITLQAQMTMAKEAEFMVELKDNQAPETETIKRDAIGAAFGVAYISLGLNLAFKKITSVIPTEQSCTIALENLSKKEVLVRPAWYLTSGETSNIVPWQIDSNEVAEITFNIPFGGVKITETFKHTAYVLSYDIMGTGHSLVICTWFPLKLERKKDKPTLKETPRYTIFIIQTPTVPMKDVLKVMGDVFMKYSHNGMEFSSALQATNRIVYNLIVYANLQRPKVFVVETKNYQKYLQWQYPILKSDRITDSSGRYFVRIISAMGIGQKTGMVVKVEVVEGESEISFAENNPQVHREQPEKKVPAKQDVGIQVSGNP